MPQVINAQHKDKPRPEAWNDLVYGARFMDRILPAPIFDGLETDTWGADAVIPRDIHNGIEDPGEAYTIDFDTYEDGTRVGWYKYERPKVLQDQYGRATHLYLAVIDISKWDDKGNDNHSSKNIALPLVVGRRLQILNDERITAETSVIKVLVKAEDGFNPHSDMDIQSLRFGAPEEVDYGKGSSVLRTKKKGKDLILIFDGKGNGIDDDNFAAKLIGTTNERKMLFGYARLPE